jgi:hypothetical protein
MFGDYYITRYMPNKILSTYTMRHVAIHRSWLLDALSPSTPLTLPRHQLRRLLEALTHPRRWPLVRRLARRYLSQINGGWRCIHGYVDGWWRIRELGASGWWRIRGCVDRAGRYNTCEFDESRCLPIEREGSTHIAWMKLTEFARHWYGGTWLSCFGFGIS